MTKKIRLIALVVLLTMQFTSLFPKNPDERIADFQNLSGIEQVDTIVNQFEDKHNYLTNSTFFHFRDIIISNIENTGDYLLNRIKDSEIKPGGIGSFYVLNSIFIELREIGEKKGWEKTCIFNSFDDYTQTLLPIISSAIDSCLRYYKTVDISIVQCIEYLNDLKGERKFYFLEDIPFLIQELEIQGYEGLTVKSEGIYPKSFYISLGLFTD